MVDIYVNFGIDRYQHSNVKNLSGLIPCMRPEAKWSTDFKIKTSMPCPSQNFLLNYYSNILLAEFARYTGLFLQTNLESNEIYRRVGLCVLNQYRLLPRMSFHIATDAIAIFLKLIIYSRIWQRAIERYAIY